MEKKMEEKTFQGTLLMSKVIEEGDLDCLKAETVQILEYSTNFNAFEKSTSQQEVFLKLTL